ncbi:MAG: thiamine pyrophosphate-binding protein [Candidatus Rokubacteria bacterium]|nr:thiamine pyrophosphate-binding protein [Candidatus Rokubacteria bacterium]
MASVNQAIIETIIEAGIDHVFALPGGILSPVFPDLHDYQNKVKVILTRNEQSASCMAEMYGRLTGKPGVLTGQGPFIASAGLFGMMEAHLTSTPMLVLADLTDYGSFALHAPFQCGTGDYGGLDLKEIFKGTAKFVTVASTPFEAVQGVQLAIKHAVSGRPGPAVCLFKVPALKGQLSDRDVARLHPVTSYLRVEKPAAYPADVERVAAALTQAKRPVIIAGNGVHAAKAYAELAQLAELCGIPVATSYQGKSVIPETHPLAVGVMNMYGEKIALRTVSEADLLLVIGCRLKPQDTCFESPELIDPRRQKIVQIDIDSRNAGWAFPVDIGLTGDAQLVMRQLIEALGDRVRAKDADWAAWTRRISDMKAEDGYFDDPSLRSEHVPIRSTRIVHELREHLPADAIVTLDGGNNRVSMLRYYATRTAGTCFAAAGIGAMSLSVPSAIAAKILHPERACVAVCGDGGMAMQIHALSTAKQYGAAAIFVVMNDSVLGAVRDHQKGRIIASEFIDTDFARIAQSFDGQGVRVRTPDEVAPAIRRALASKDPFVIDVLTDPDERIREAVVSPWARKGLASM